jgi:F-type H+-transporting ATPase subunit epsilon
MHRDKIKLKIITPEKIIENADYDAVILPGETGDFELLANHENFISTLRAGAIYASTKDHIAASFVVSKSFMRFSHAQNVCEVAAEYAMSMVEIKQLGADEITRRMKEASSESKKQFYQCAIVMMLQKDLK